MGRFLYLAGEVCEEKQVFDLVAVHMALFPLNNALSHLSDSARVFSALSTVTTPLERWRHLTADPSGNDTVVHVEINIKRRKGPQPALAVY